MCGTCLTTTASLETTRVMQTRIMLRRDAGAVGPRHGPWIRKRQVSRRFGPSVPGAVVEVVDAKDRILGWGLFSPASEIVVRMLAFAATSGSKPPGEDWLTQSLQVALRAREHLRFESRGTTGYREVNSEGDGLPGLVVDRYGEDRVVLITTAAMASYQDAIVEWLAPQTAGRVFVHSPERAAKREEFEARPMVVGGQASSDEVMPLTFSEQNLHLQAPPPPAQKTGAFLDQRDNHIRIAELAAQLGGPVLDIGCHLGGFALHAAQRGCHAVGIDQSQRALGYAADNAARNQLGERVRWLEGDLFHPRTWLSELKELPQAFQGPFAAVVVDPPSVARTRRDVTNAREAMTRVVASLVGQVMPGGLLVICSCSHHLGSSQLDRIVLEAIGGRPWPRILNLGPGLDHPVMPGHESGEYLRIHVYQQRS